MNKKNLILFGLLFAVVFFSGCTMPGQQVSTVGKGGIKGVVINEFSPDVSEIYSGDSVMFTAMVENIGEETARNVKLKLFGLGTDWEGSDNLDWDDFVDWDGKIKEIGTLGRSEPEENIPGDTGDAQWEVKSPDNLRVDNTYTAAVRLYYQYSTTGLANIKVYNNDYLRSNPEKANTIMQSSGIDTFTVTDAPVNIDLAGLSKPLVYRGSGQIASLTVLINNVGEGKTYLDSDNENKPYVTIEKITVDDKSCKNLDLPSDVRLPRTGQKSISCQFELPEVDSYTTLPLEIELNYNYFVDSSTSIRVLKSLYLDDDFDTGDSGKSDTTDTEGPVLEDDL